MLRETHDTKFCPTFLNCEFIELEIDENFITVEIEKPRSECIIHFKYECTTINSILWKLPLTRSKGRASPDNIPGYEGCKIEEMRH